MAQPRQVVGQVSEQCVTHRLVEVTGGRVGTPFDAPCHRIRCADNRHYVK